MDCDSVTDGLTKCFHLRHWGDIDTDLGDTLVDMNVDDNLGDTDVVKYFGWYWCGYHFGDIDIGVDDTLFDINVDDNLGDTNMDKYFGWCSLILWVILMCMITWVIQKW